ncbi:hypothetical protein MTO96_008713 [Rhipicephalus appendiculatus]
MVWPREERLSKSGTTKCLCPAAFSGPACLDDVDECLLRRPCGRFSVCTNLYGSFRCDCMPGFQRQAHLCIREVSCEEGPCLNGGTCVTRDDLTDVCYCKIGFRGRLCEIAVPECSLGTCPGGGPSASAPGVDFVVCGAYAIFVRDTGCPGNKRERKLRAYLTRRLECRLRVYDLHACR